MRSPWLKAVALLAGVWLLVAGIIWLARGAKPTPDSIIRYTEQHELKGKSAADRDKILHRVAEQVSALEYEQRREMRLSKKMDGFFKELNPDEQNTFIDLTLPSGFKQMMESLNKMTPQRRKNFVERALADMRKRGDEETPDDPVKKKIVEQGLQAFYTDATAETKMDLAPFVEQMQKNLQGLP